jgi:Na+/H+-dicarboxylate symporter
MNSTTITVLTVIEFLKQWCRKNAFLLVTILSVFIGILLGIVIRQFVDLNAIEKSYLGFPGEIFLRLIKLLILPLIVSSLISSIGNIAKHNIGECFKILYKFKFN